MRSLMTIVALLLTSASIAAAAPAPATTAPAAGTARDIDPALAAFLKRVEIAPGDDALLQKLKERHNTAVTLLQLHIDRYRSGIADSSTVFASARDVANAKMSLAQTGAERQAAAQQIVDVLNLVEARVEQQFKAGVGPEVTVLDARLARETAEIELLRIKQPATAPTTQPR